MLSIGVVRSSAAAVSYYEKDDYYTAGSGEVDRQQDAAGDVGVDADAQSEGQGVWWGAGAARLGLSGAVAPEVFRDTLEGRLPGGEMLGTVRGGQWVHRPGWDLTFSAPKSVSIVAEVGGDARVLAAHDAAVQTALGWLQANAAAYRQRDGDAVRTVASDNLVVALFQHHVSRNQEPQLHTHAVVANATQRQDGRWASLTSEPLFDHKMAAGNVYRAELAHALRGMGYQIERTHKDGRFEIAGVSPALAKEFSSRREAIERALVERGLSGPVASAKAALLTRRSKQHVARSELVPVWERVTDALGIDVRGVVEDARARWHEVSVPVSNTYGALREAINRLSEREAVFSHADLVRWTLAAGMGQTRLADVEQTARNSPELVRTRLEGRAAWTTGAARDRERRVLDALDQGRGAVNAVATAEAAVRVAIAAGLDDGQRDAVRLVATSTDRLVGVLGRPGTGKTRLLGTVSGLLVGHGYRAVGLATNAEAARVLAADSGIGSMTVRRHLGKVGRDVRHVQTAVLPWTAAGIRADYVKQVWIVDEASQLGSADARKLSTYAALLGARIVMVGDTAQLPAIDAGRPFAQLLAAGMQHVELDVIRRQRSAEDVAAIRDVIRGDVEQALVRLADRTVEAPDAAGRIAAIVAQWTSMSDRDRAETSVLTARNVERAQLNDALRNVLRREGKLVGEQAHIQLVKRGLGRADRQLAESYAMGDVVRFGREVASLGIGAGEYRRVVLADPGSNVVVLEGRQPDGSPTLIPWNPRELAAGASNGVEVYRPQENSVAPGEVIAWGRNQPDRGLTNGQVVTVLGVHAGVMTIRTAEGRVVDVDGRRPEGQHWDHVYATTVYKAQGRTTTQTLVNVESDRRELFSQKAFLVAISRHTERLSLFVDDREQVAEALVRHRGEKTSALDSGAAPEKQGRGALRELRDALRHQDRNTGAQERGREDVRNLGLER